MRPARPPEVLGAREAPGGPVAAPDATPMSLAERLVATWYAPRPGVLALALAPLAAMFAVASWARRIGYRLHLLPRQRAAVPVIVVGNIAVGGTGKTPLVIALAARLAARGWHPAVVSRGTGGHLTGARVVTADADPLEVGDEPLLMARRGLVVAIGRKRIDAARCALAAHPGCDVLIADDGLQHYAMERDVEVAVVDGARRFGNGWLLPAGPLRERPGRLREVDAVVVNGPPEGDIQTRGYAMHLLPEALVNLADPARTLPVDAFAGTTVHAVAGIGDPGRFFASLRKLGVGVVCHPFPDHHRYRPRDLTFAADAVVMTEKDAVKCMRFAEAHWWFVRARAEIDEALVDRVVACLSRAAARRASGPQAA